MGGKETRVKAIGVREKGGRQQECNLARSRVEKNHDFF